MSHRRRVWCETLSLDTLLAPGTLALLRRFSIAPIVAVWPTTPIERVERVVATFDDLGLPAALWPMIEDAEGRWANVANAAPFVRFAGALVERLIDLRRPPSELVVDLEPAIDDLRAALRKDERGPSAHALPITLDKRAFDEARARFTTLAEGLLAQGVSPSAAVPPMVLLEAQDGHATPWQERLGTPVDGPRWGQVAVMVYTSILEGWSRGVLRRDEARALLGIAARASTARFGAKASLCVGAVGTGAFGNEPVYRSVDELADDVAIASKAGVVDLSLFDLGGVLRRGSPEPWLEAFAATPPADALPEASLRLRSVLGAAQLAGGVFGLLGRVRDATVRW